MIGSVGERVGDVLENEDRRLDRAQPNAGGGELGGTSLHTIMLPQAACGAAQDSLTIRLADCDGHRNRANMLLNRRYSWRGYGADHQIPATPDSITFTATKDEDLIGTITLTVDSPAGLAADRTFAEEIETFRQSPGARLCELTKFAFDPSGHSRPRLAALFHIIFIYGSAHFDCTDLFIEVNPRHRRYYEAMLGFRPVGEVKTNGAVAAPAQLMWLNVGEIRRQIDRFVADPATGGRSLYPYFFSRKEEEGIYGRLVAGQGKRHPTSAELIAASSGDARNTHDSWPAALAA